MIQVHMKHTHINNTRQPHTPHGSLFSLALHKEEADLHNINITYGMAVYILQIQFKQSYVHTGYLK